MDLSAQQGGEGYPEKYRRVTATPSHESGFFIVSTGGDQPTVVTELAVVDCSQQDIDAIEEGQLDTNRPIVEEDPRLPGGIRAAGRKVLRYSTVAPDQTARWHTASAVQEFVGLPAEFQVRSTHNSIEE